MHIPASTNKTFSPRATVIPCTTAPPFPRFWTNLMTRMLVLLACERWDVHVDLNIYMCICMYEYMCIHGYTRSVQCMYTSFMPHTCTHFPLIHAYTITLSLSHRLTHLFSKCTRHVMVYHTNTITLSHTHTHTHSPVQHTHTPTRTCCPCFRRQR
jgi:hypothetical protein